MQARRAVMAAVNATGRIADQSGIERAIEAWIPVEAFHHQQRFHILRKRDREDHVCESSISLLQIEQWLSEGQSPVLSITGAIGSGKTYLASWLSDALHSTREEYEVVCYYCFDQERGVVHALSAILLGLVDQFPDQRETFRAKFREIHEEGTLNHRNGRPAILCIIHAMLQVAKRPVCFVLDGWDQSDESAEVQSNLLEALTLVKGKSKVIYTTRLGGLIECDAEDHMSITRDAARDKAYADHLLASTNYPQDVRELLSLQLSKQALGNLLWLEQTVASIKSRGLVGLEQLQDFLRASPLPESLYRVYDDAFVQHVRRSPSPDQIEATMLLVTALAVIAAACRPLSVAELSWAVQLRRLERNADPAIIPASVFGALPFVDPFDENDMTKPQISLAHPSIRRYIETKLMEQPSSENSMSVSGASGINISPELRAVLAGGLEEFMLNLCLRCLLRPIPNTRPLFSDDELALLAFPHGSDVFEEPSQSGDEDHYGGVRQSEPATTVRYDPVQRGFGHLFVYASCHWTTHLGRLENISALNLIMVEMVCAAGSLQLDNWTKQNCRPTCTLQPDFLFDSSQFDPLSIVGIYGSGRVLSRLLQQGSLASGLYLPDTQRRAIELMDYWNDPGRGGC